MRAYWICLIALLALSTFRNDVQGAERPNFIFILSDDLAQGDVGCYGQKLIQTPNLDRMAAEGTRFLQAYSGTSVCAPSRTSVITGLHTGHSPIRANREAQPEGQKPLPEGTYTVARLLKDHGYATACVGKWGMGMFDTPGSPLKVGFDHFYGYNCQRHAHSYFPTYLYNDDQRFELPGNTGKGVGATYAQNLISDESLRWIREHKDEPFFLFYAITLPHGRYEIDDLGIYRDRDWTPQQKAYAAMVTRLDSDVGRVLDLLRELNLSEKTLVITSGDNGSSFAPDSQIGQRFDQTMGGKLRGFKRSLYEGGLRQAAIAWQPGTVPAGRVTDEPWAFWDYLPTVAEMIGAELPKAGDQNRFSVAVNAVDHPKIHALGKEQLQDATARVVMVNGQRKAEWVPIALGEKGQPKVDQVSADELLREVIVSGRPQRELLVMLDGDETETVPGSLIASASRQDDSGRPVVAISFTAEGGQRMSALTTRYQPVAGSSHRRRLAVIFGGKVHSAPLLHAAIGQRCIIEGRFTAAEVDSLVHGLTAPTPITDGLSLVSFLKGGSAPQRDYFYWELHEGPSLQAVRIGNWKGVRNGPSRPIELYNLATDESESNDVAASHPEIVSRVKDLMVSARTDSPDWPLVDKRRNK